MMQERMCGNHASGQVAPCIISHDRAGTQTDHADMAQACKSVYRAPVRLQLGKEGRLRSYRISAACNCHKQREARHSGHKPMREPGVEMPCEKSGEWTMKRARNDSVSHTERKEE